MYLLILTTHNGKLKEASFTFQSVSINSSMCCKGLPPTFALHSKVYLLIPILRLFSYHIYFSFSFCRSSLPDTSYIYISLCKFTLTLYLYNCRPTCIFSQSMVDNYFIYSPLFHNHTLSFSYRN